MWPSGKQEPQDVESKRLSSVAVYSLSSVGRVDRTSGVRGKEEGERGASDRSSMRRMMRLACWRLVPNQAFVLGSGLRPLSYRLGCGEMPICRMTGRSPGTTKQSLVKAVRILAEASCGRR